MLQALKGNNIQCMAVYEPFAASAVVDGYGRYPDGIDLGDNSFLGINGVFAVNSDFLKKNPQFAQDAVKVIVDATEAYNKDKKSLVSDVAKRLQLKPEVVSVGADHIVLDSKLYENRANMMASAMQKLGFIRQVPDKAKLAAYFDFDFLTKAAGKPADQVGKTE
jgi:ABC-type nitrate/sulfonate/bicarbonate transport system substrate-binding protein